MTTIRGDMHQTTGRGAVAARRSRWIRAIAVATAIMVAPTVAVLGTPASPAYAVDYPSWDDVQKAVADVRAAEALKTQIEAQLVALQAEVTRTQADAEAKGLLYDEAQTAYDEQVLVTQNLQGQADAASAEALSAQKAAERLLAELGKPGGGSLTTSLISNPGRADELLYKIGTMQKITESANSIYADALRKKNDAQSLTDQAATAQTELDRRKVLAEEAFQVAQAAATAAQAALVAEQENRARLEAQLVVLREKRAATQADYQKGLVERWGAGAGAGGEVNMETGWARPAGGYITSQFGRRYHPIYKVWKLHSGTDLTGGGCGGPIYAAHGGVVTYAGPNGDLGNFIQIDHGSGVTTGYGHIAPGGILVQVGQPVAPGQNIARVGTTGGSTGCHLHYIVRQGGNLVDPVPFMRSQGMPLG